MKRITALLHRHDPPVIPDNDCDIVGPGRSKQRAAGEYFRHRKTPLTQYV